MKSLFLLVCLAFCSTDAQLKWSAITSAGGSRPSERAGASFGYDPWSDTLILFGGGSNSTWVFDLSNSEWSEVMESEYAPASRSYAYYGLIRFGGEFGTSLFVVSHGIGGTGEFEDTWVFNLDSYNWTEVTTSGEGPGKRYGGHYGTFNGTSNEFWMGGGFTFTTTLNTRYIDTYKLVFTSETEASWDRVHDQPTIGNQFDPLVPHGRCLQGSAVVEAEKIVIWGGCMRGGTGGGPCPSDDSWFFDNGDATWTELPRCATPRVWSAMAPLTDYPGKALLYGGSVSWSGQVFAVSDWPEEEVFVVDVNDKEWTRYMTAAVNNTYPWRRFDHSMTYGKDGAIYMFGGKLLSNESTLNDLWMLSGDLEGTETADCDNVWFSYAHLHGLINAIAFGILLPIGFLIARYYRCKGSKVWFIIHVAVQITAVIFAITAFIIIFPTGASPEPTHPHAIIGIILMFLLLVQPINGIFRPHIKDGEKTKYRVCWEWFHRIWGISTILIGLTQVSLGVFLIVPPRPVWITWIVMLFGWMVTFVVHEIVKCVCLLFRHKKDVTEEMEMKNAHP